MHKLHAVALFGKMFVLVTTAVTVPVPGPNKRFDKGENDTKASLHIFSFLGLFGVLILRLPGVIIVFTDDAHKLEIRTIILFNQIIAFFFYSSTDRFLPL